MHDRLPAARLLGVALLAAVAATACQRGQGSNDTLADGTIDRPTANNGSTAVGPGAPPVDSASPALGNSASQPGSGAGSAPTLVLVPQGPRGPYISSSAGQSLYYVEGDRDGSKCTGDCLQAWPPVLVSGQQPNGGPGLQGAMITTINRPEGGTQVVYNGHPLYRYAADAGAGAANGDGVKDRYGTWHLATAEVAGGAATQPGTTSGSTTGGSTGAGANGAGTNGTTQTTTGG